MNDNSLLERHLIVWTMILTRSSTNFTNIYAIEYHLKSYVFYQPVTLNIPVIVKNSCNLLELS